MSAQRKILLAAGLAAVLLGGCERKWKGDHIEPLRPLPRAKTQAEYDAEAIAEERDRLAKLPECPAGDFRFEVDGLTPLTDWAGAAGEVVSPPVKLADGASGALHFLQFNYEALPWKDGRGGVGIVFARADDGRLVGGVLWGDGLTAPEGIGDFAPVDGGVELTLSAVDQGPVPCWIRYRLQFRADGRLTANGAVVGQLK